MNYRRLLTYSLLNIIIVFSSCSKELVIDETTQIDPFHISICALGNSYTSDSFSYVPFILKEYGYTCSLHIYCRPNGSLKLLDSDWSNKSSSLYFYIDTRFDSEWQSSESIAPADLLLKERWDIITVQQVSTQVRNKASYSPYLDNILIKIGKSIKYPATLAWFMAFNGANDNENDVNLDVQKDIVGSYPFDLVLPVSTAIFNSQANEVLARIGGHKNRKLYCSDGSHLQEGLPCYIAALAIVEALLRKMCSSENVLGDKIRPTQDWILSVNGLTRHGGSTGVTDSNCILAQKAAINANDYPFKIIPVE